MNKVDVLICPDCGSTDAYQTFTAGLSKPKIECSSCGLSFTDRSYNIWQLFDNQYKPVIMFDSEEERDKALEELE